MNPRERKKEPPDPLLSFFDLPITSSFLVDLAMSLLMHRFPFPAIPFPCSLLDLTLPSETRCYQIDSRVQSTTRRFRSQPESATILEIFWVPNLTGCCGLLGSTRWQVRCCQDWRIGSVSCASVRPPSLRPPQVSATSLPISYYSNGLF